MKKPKAEFRLEYVNNLSLADWNYKEDDEVMKQKLIAGIKKNGFVQNLVVRHVDGKIEVVDGNHRLDALRDMGVQEVQVCDLGEIPDEQAYMLSVTLNETRFQNNDWRLQTIVKQISEAYSMEDVQSVLPYSDKAIDMMINKAEIDWDNMDNPAIDEPDDKQGFNTITLQVKDDVFETWKRWCDKVEVETNNKSKALAFEHAVVEALNTK